MPQDQQYKATLPDGTVKTWPPGTPMEVMQAEYNELARGMETQQQLAPQPEQAPPTAKPEGAPPPSSIPTMGAMGRQNVTFEAPEEGDYYEGKGTDLLRAAGVVGPMMIPGMGVGAMGLRTLAGALGLGGAEAIDEGDPSQLGWEALIQGGLEGAGKGLTKVAPAVRKLAYRTGGAPEPLATRATEAVTREHARDTRPFLERVMNPEQRKMTVGEQSRPNVRRREAGQALESAETKTSMAPFGLDDIALAGADRRFSTKARDVANLPDELGQAQIGELRTFLKNHLLRDKGVPDFDLAGQTSRADSLEALDQMSLEELLNFASEIQWSPRRAGVFAAGRNQNAEKVIQRRLARDMEVPSAQRASLEAEADRARYIRQTEREADPAIGEALDRVGDVASIRQADRHVRGGGTLAGSPAAAGVRGGTVAGAARAGAAATGMFGSVLAGAQGNPQVAGILGAISIGALAATPRNISRVANALESIGMVGPDAIRMAEALFETYGEGGSGQSPLAVRRREP